MQSSPGNTICPGTYMPAKSLWSCPTLCDHMDCSLPGSFVRGDSPGKDTGVGCHALLQGIFLIQGSNPHLSHLVHWQVGSLPLEPLGKPLHESNFQEMQGERNKCFFAEKNLHKSRTVFKTKNTLGQLSSKS